MNIIIFDFEVFKNDTLLGALILSDDDIQLYQTWDLKDIKQFYLDHSKDVWVGHNNEHYDNIILQSIVKDFTQQQIKQINDNIIENGKMYWLNIPLIFYDLMDGRFYALKQMEAFDGKNISETEVDFNLDRSLNQEEIELTENYNLDDLIQTYDDFIYLKCEFEQRLDIINEFNLPLQKCMSITGTGLAEEVLHAKKTPGIETWSREPVLWPTLRIKNKEVIDFYLSKKWADKETLDFTVCGTDHKMARGGLHGDKKCCHVDWAYYFDVSGYYNLIMINLDLLPRSIPKEYQQLYVDMYHEQLRLKKINPVKRQVYKTILLSVFGAMSNENCRFYDPYNGDLVRMSGQMYLIDLLEKLEGFVEVVQSNTDGIIAVPINGTTDEQVSEILNEWQTRTGFVLKFDKVYNLHQRDINCYMYRDENNNIETRGDTITHYDKINSPFVKNSYNSREPLIFANIIVNYFMLGKLPEQTVEESKRDLRLFQYICKKGSTFKYVEYEKEYYNSNVIDVKKIQNVNRAFADRSNDYKGMIYKCKPIDNCNIKRSKVPNLPPSVIIYNDEILSDTAINNLIKSIDYQYYIDRGYEKIQQFYSIPTVKEILV